MSDLPEDLRRFLLYIAKYRDSRGRSVFAVVSPTADSALHNVIKPLARYAPEDVTIRDRSGRLEAEVFGCRVVIITERMAHEGANAVRGLHLGAVFVDPDEPFRDPGQRLLHILAPCMAVVDGQVFGAQHLLHSVSFTEAFPALYEGKAIRRRSWPEEAWLVLVPGSRITVEQDRPLGHALPYLAGRTLTYASHIDMVTEDHKVTPWAPTQADLLATDWAIR